MYKKLITFGSILSFLGLNPIAASKPSLLMTQNTETTLESLGLIDEIINNALNLFNVPGTAIGLVIDDQIVLARGF